jgi:hypothetical protein
MESILSVIAWVTASGPNLVSAIVAVLVAVIAVCAMIPGEQPEKALQGVVDFLAKFSKKS